MNNYDGRVKESTNKCKDCKWCQRADRYTFYCVHPIWAEHGTWGGTSCRMGLSTTACLRFEKK